MGLQQKILELQDLEGRVVGRNNDDAAFLCKGLEVLLREWEAMESRVQDSNQLMEQASHLNAELTHSLYCTWILPQEPLLLGSIAQRKLCTAV